MHRRGLWERSQVAPYSVYFLACAEHECAASLRPACVPLKRRPFPQGAPVGAIPVAEACVLVVWRFLSSRNDVT